MPGPARGGGASRRAALASAVVLAGVLASALPAAGLTFFAIATGGTGGTYYPLGGMLAQLLSNQVKDLVATAQAGNASVANILLVGRGEIESAFAQNDVAYWAYTGTGLEPFRGRPVGNIRHVASLYPEHVQLVATRASGIRSVRDLAGRRVVLGARGSGNVVEAEAILEAYGMSPSDLEAVYAGHSEGVSRIEDGQADAMFVVAGFPTAALVDLAAGTDVVIVPLDDDAVRRLAARSRFFTPAVVPAGTYRGQTQDVRTVAVMATWIVDERVPADLVYEMTKALWAKRDVLEAVHPKGREVRLETALAGMAIPPHPGAERYYRERGLLP
ncbi:MAG TPA: TAXI family TRAP transporter solute-binding subunit [Thermodesulfobacteriota bacterium]